MALDRGGRVIVWGGHPALTSAIPSDLGKVTAIACGQSHCLALKEGGEVAEWGIPQDVRIQARSGINVRNDWEAPKTLHNVSGVSAGRDFSIAIVRPPVMPVRR